MTPRMRQTLDFIEGYHRDNRVMPTLEEIKDAMGITARSGAHRIVSLLVEEGCLQRLPGRKRNIALAAVNLDNVPTDALRAELARREVPRG